MINQKLRKGQDLDLGLSLEVDDVVDLGVGAIDGEAGVEEELEARRGEGGGIEPGLGVAQQVVAREVEARGAGARGAGAGEVGVEVGIAGWFLFPTFLPSIFFKGQNLASCKKSKYFLSIAVSQRTLCRNLTLTRKKRTQKLSFWIVSPFFKNTNIKKLNLKNCNI